MVCATMTLRNIINSLLSHLSSCESNVNFVNSLYDCNHTDQIIYWNNTELMDEAVGNDFDLNEETVLQLSTSSLKYQSDMENQQPREEYNEYEQSEQQEHEERGDLRPNSFDRSPTASPSGMDASSQHFSSFRAKGSSPSQMLASPPTFNKARVITLTPALNRGVQNQERTPPKIEEPIHEDVSSNVDHHMDQMEQQEQEELNHPDEAYENENENDESNSEDDEDQIEQYDRSPQINPVDVVESRVDARRNSPASIPERKEDDYIENVPSPRVLYSMEPRRMLEREALIQHSPPRKQVHSPQVEMRREISPKVPTPLSPRIQGINAMRDSMVREQFDADINQLMKQMTEEKATLMRMWANEKKEILRKANEDREQLMLENSRLRKEMNSSYVNYNIDNMESDLNQLRRRYQLIEKQNKELQAQLFQAQQQIETMRDEYKNEQEKWIKESQDSQEDIKRLSLQIRSEQDRVADLKQNQQIRDQLNRERMKWEESKQMIFKNWKEEVEILTAVAKNERDSWYNEKISLVKQMESEKMVSIRERESQIVSLNDNLDDAYGEIDTLRQENENLNTHIKNIASEYEHNKLLAQSADVAIRELKYQIRELMSGSDSSELLSNAIQQRVLEEKRSEKISQENIILRERLHEEMRKRKYLHNILEDMKGNIRVIIRMRPILDGERRGDQQGGRVEIKDDQTVSVYTHTQGTKLFEFFRALNETATQEEVFEEIKPLIQSAIDGYNVCIMAYGQTGSGKTFTIYGDDNGQHRGVLPRAANYLFDALRRYSFSPSQHFSGSSPQRMNTFSVKCSMIELYLDNIFDLLEDTNGKKFDMKQHQSGFMYVPGVSEYTINSPEALLELLMDGNRKRQVHRTEMNIRSSRSHSIFTIYLTTSFNKGDEVITTNSKILFVDLAGSERISKSHSEGERLKEATHINKSLSALGDVIAALSSEKKGFVPYRNSKLTLLLQDSIGGNSKTIMFANISPSSASTSETVSTLNFSSRVKTVQNHNVRNATILSSITN